MLRRLLLTDSGNYAALLVRLTLGIVMFPHGAQKALGCFGGPGFQGTMNVFTQNMGIPAIFAFLAIVAEFLGSIGLITGCLTRVSAFGIACVMVVAVLMVHGQHGFFMNWYGAQQGEGFEYHLFAIGISAALMMRGGGAWSVDALLSRRMASGV